MSRIKFLETSPKDFIEKIQDKKELTLQELAAVCGVHRRSFSDWKYGQCLMPRFVFQKLVKLGNLNSPKIKILPEFWHNREAGRKGGLSVYKKYGNFPKWTKEASRRGGLASIKTHRRKGSEFFVPKNIFLPRKSFRLAEFIGIILGDGGISRRQIIITVHKNDDKEFILYIQNLIKSLFLIKPSFWARESVVNITISRTKLVQFLTSMGLCIGSKVKNQVDVPEWIKLSKLYTRACLRGLFDTDGCFYIDKHFYKNIIYHNCGMSFTNRSLPILIFFKTKLEQLGFHPTQNTKFNITLRKENEIIRYFQTIGSSNPKHKNKFKKYFKNKTGEVPKWS